ncbi:hypothetical protein PV326_010487 [Microctonus aethiopoides]|nr:hypothetical protein PV326_010487 [Microctonus aethiopoides]
MDLERHFEKAEIIANPVNRILQTTSDGRSLIKYYIKKGQLKKNLRNLLSRLVIGAEKEKQLSLAVMITKQQFVAWSEDIQKLFPGECKSLYYTPFRCISVEEVQNDGSVTNKKLKINTKGILFEHYEYSRSKLKQQDKLEEEEIEKTVEQPLYQATEEEQQAVEWLGTHLGPPDRVKSSWTITYSARQTILRKGCEISDYFRQFPTLKGALGAELLSEDFKRHHPYAEETFYTRWSCARDIIKTALADCNKLKGVDLGYYSALPALNQHNKDSVLFHLLPYLINSPRTKHRVGNITISEKQEAFLIRAETAADINGALERQRQICIATGSTLQPIPVIVGPLVNPESFYVYVNDSLENPTIYQSEDFLKTITLTVTLAFALNSAYTERALSVWTFIQKALFGIDLPTDKCSRETSVLIARISHSVERADENTDPNQI